MTLVKATLVALLLTISIGFADSPWPDAKTLVSGNKLRWQRATTKNIPSGIRQQLGGGYSVDPKSEYASPQFCRFDFNHDGIAEYIIESSEPFSGGAEHTVFQLRHGRWRQIATWQGGVLILVHRTDGYNDIELWSRAGGGEFSRIIERYKQGRYHTVRIEDWRMTDVGEKFVGRRNPKDYSDNK